MNRAHSESHAVIREQHDFIEELFFLIVNMVGAERMKDSTCLDRYQLYWAFFDGLPGVITALLNYTIGHIVDFSWMYGGSGDAACARWKDFNRILFAELCEDTFQFIFLCPDDQEARSARGASWRGMVVHNPNVADLGLGNEDEIPVGPYGPGSSTIISGVEGLRLPHNTLKTRPLGNAWQGKATG